MDYADQGSERYDPKILQGSECLSLSLTNSIIFNNEVTDLTPLSLLLLVFYSKVLGLTPLKIHVIQIRAPVREFPVPLNLSWFLHRSLNTSGVYVTSHRKQDFCYR